MARTLQRNRTMSTETTEETDNTPTMTKRGDSSSRPARAKRTVDWDSFDKLKPKAAGYAEEFKPTEAETIFRFQEDAFLSTYRLHWITRKGKRSFICLITPEDQDADCPLCDIGDPVRVNAVYNVLILSKTDSDGNLVPLSKPTPAVWTVTSKKLQDQIKNYSKDAKTKPLNRDNLYWSVKRQGEGTSTVYPLNAVRERDLVDSVEEGGYGWDQKFVLTPEQVAEWQDQAYDEDFVVKRSTAEELNAIVKEIS